MITYDDKQAAVNPADPQPNEKWTFGNANEVKTQVNNIYGVSSGALGSPYELTFDVYQRYRTLSVDSNILLALAASGKVANSYETLTVTGNGVNTLTFPAEWVMLGDAFNFNKVQEIAFRWTGAYVIGVITTLDNVPVPPVLSSAIIEDATDNRLDLAFDMAVDITTAGWTITASGGPVTVDAVASGSGTTTPKFTLSRSIASTETVTVSYDSATGATENAQNIELVSITDQAVTNNVYTIIMSDDFADASIDTAKWDVTDPADGVTISETGGRLRFTANPASPVASSNTNVLETDATLNWDAGTRRVMQFTLYRNAQSVNQVRAVQIFKDTNNGFKLQCVNDITVSIVLTVAGVNTYSIDTGINWDSVTWKFVQEANNDLKVYSWSVSSWIQRGATQNANLGTALRLRMGVNSVNTDTGTPIVEMDNFYLVDKDYSTATP